MTNFDSEFGESDSVHFNFRKKNPDETPKEEPIPEQTQETLEERLEHELVGVQSENETKSEKLSLKERLKNLMWQSVQFGAFGIAGEVLFNSARYAMFHDGDIGLRGHSYAWMLPIWMGAAPVYNLIAPKLQKYGVITRAVIYGAAILGAEYALGYGLRETIGICPWSEEYAGTPFSVNDLVRLDWFPIWAGAGLGVEQLWKITTGYKKPELKETKNVTGTETA